MNVNSERKYVIVCNEHLAIFKDALLFWGSLTDDSSEMAQFVLLVVTGVVIMCLLGWW